MKKHRLVAWATLMCVAWAASSINAGAPLTLELLTATNTDRDAEYEVSFPVGLLQSAIRSNNSSAAHPPLELESLFGTDEPVLMRILSVNEGTGEYSIFEAEVVAYVNNEEEDTLFVNGQYYEGALGLPVSQSTFSGQIYMEEVPEDELCALVMDAQFGSDPTAPIIRVTSWDMPRTFPPDPVRR